MRQHSNRLGKRVATFVRKCGSKHADAGVPMEPRAGGEGAWQAVLCAVGTQPDAFGTVQLRAERIRNDGIFSRTEIVAAHWCA